MKLLKIYLLLPVLLLGTTLLFNMANAAPGNPQVIIITTLGNIQVELQRDKAPLTVKNFLEYVDGNFYANTLFHRVIPNFMIQGGGFTKGMVEKQTGLPIKNEAGNGLSNLRGTIAMARTGVVDSATSEFFINVHDNKFLDHQNDTPGGFGYCVFGRVVKGMNVVDEIVNVPTGNVGQYQDVPVQDVVIKAIKRVK